MSPQHCLASEGNYLSASPKNSITADTDAADRTASTGLGVVRYIRRKLRSCDTLSSISTEASTSVHTYIATAKQ